jgi:hypothetical protein
MAPATPLSSIGPTSRNTTAAPAEASTSEPIERRRVEEVERDLAAADRGAEAFKGNARPRQTDDEPDAAEVARHELVPGGRCDDPQLHQPTELFGAESAPLRRLGQVVRLHGPYCSGRAPSDSGDEAWSGLQR